MNDKKTVKYPTSIFDAGVWELECINCGCVTFVTSSISSPPRWAETVSLGPPEWETYPQQCWVCGFDRADPFIWRSYPWPVAIGPLYIATVEGYQMSSGSDVPVALPERTVTVARRGKR